jgi:hypothetical protein
MHALGSDHFEGGFVVLVVEDFELVLVQEFLKLLEQSGGSSPRGRWGQWDAKDSPGGEA